MATDCRNRYDSNNLLIRTHSTPCDPIDRYEKIDINLWMKCKATRESYLVLLIFFYFFYLFLRCVDVLTMILCDYRSP